MFCERAGLVVRSRSLWPAADVSALGRPAAVALLALLDHAIAAYRWLRLYGADINEFEDKAFNKCQSESIRLVD